MPDIPSSTQNSFAKITPTNAALVAGIENFGLIPAVLSAINKLIGDVSWQDDKSNKRIKYMKVEPVPVYTDGYQRTYSDGATCLYAYMADSGFVAGGEIQVNPDNHNVDVTGKHEIYGYIQDFSCSYSTENKKVEKYLLYSEVAAQIQTNAATGDADANTFIADVCNPLNWTESDYPLDMQSIKDQLEANAPKE